MQHPRVRNQIISRAQYYHPSPASHRLSYEGDFDGSDDMGFGDEMDF